jgi:hypothetical protein
VIVEGDDHIDVRGSDFSFPFRMRASFGFTFDTSLDLDIFLSFSLSLSKVQFWWERKPDRDGPRM